MQITASSKYFVPILTRDPRYMVLYGSRLSAKTTMMGTKLAIKMEADKYCSIVAIRKIYAKCKDSIYAEIKDAVERNGWGDHYVFKVSPLEIVNVQNGNKCIFRGLDDPNALKGLKEVNVLAIDEANEISKDDFVQSNLSIRTSKKDTDLFTILCFNPETAGNGDWLEDYWFPHDRQSYEKEDGAFTYIKSKIPNTILMHSCALHHNDYLTKDQRDALELMRTTHGESSNVWRVSVLGLWGRALVDRVYTNVEVGSWFPDEDECKIFGYGLDFGWRDSTALTQVALHNGELYVKEVIYEGGLTNTGPRSIVSRMEDYGVSKRSEIFADQADPKSIEEIYRSGYNIRKADKGKGSILAGITCMQGFKINVINSPSIEKEMKLYVYTQDKEGNSIPDKPIDNWNHALDSIRYLVRMKIMTPAKTFQLF